MTIARSKLIDRTRPTWVHCTSRCVRRAFLCGDTFEHRRTWVEKRLEFLSRCFAVEVAGYAVMANHLHVIVRMDRESPQGWSDLQIARRWLSIYPRTYLSDGTSVLPTEAEIARHARDVQRVAA